MFKVECPGCKASYNVDERRVPAGTGMKMRCPKCTTTFQVKRPGEAEPAPSAPPATPPAAPPAAPGRVRKSTVIGLGGLAPGLPGAPAPTPVAGPGRASTAAAPQTEEEDLLPAVVMPKGRTSGPPMARASDPDLPAPLPPRANKPANAPPPLDEIDLPAVAADLPALAHGAGARSRTAAAVFDDLDDLPAVAADLPALARPGNRPAPSPPAGKSERQITGGVLFDDLDLPDVAADLPAPRGADLPALKKGADLPALKTGADLPAVKKGADLPALKTGADLPVPKLGADLPAPRGADLPALKKGADLPTLKGGFGEIDLPMVPAAPPMLKGAPTIDDDFGFDEVPQAPPGRNVPPLMPREPSLPDDFGPPPGPAGFGSSPGPAGFGSPGPASFGSPPEATGFDDDDPFGAPPPPRPAPAPPPQPRAEVKRQAGGGQSFGEVDLGEDNSDFSTASEFPKGPAASAPPASNWGDRDLGGDDMEFGEIPQEKDEGTKEPSPSARSTTAAAPAAPAAPADARPRASLPSGSGQTAPQIKPSSGKGLRVAALVLVSLVLVGGGLGFTTYGPFGSNFIIDQIKAKDYLAAEASTRQTLRTEFAKDTVGAASKALEDAEATHARLPRAGGVTLLAAYAAYLKEIRFGHDSAQHAHGNTLMATLATSSDPPASYDLGKAAQAAASDQLARGKSMIEAYLRKNPADVDALGLAAEIALASRDADRAIELWTKLSEDGSPRSTFGLARASLLKQDNNAAQAAAKKTLEQEPSHVGALLLLARMAWENQRDEATASKMLDKVIKGGEKQGASKEEMVLARTLSGQIHLSRSRVSAAEAAFAEALKLNPKASGALEGMGESLYRAGRYAEALARFGSAMEADPEAVEPKLGVAKTKLALERLQEAKELMRGLDKKLRESNHPSFKVVHWKGRVSEALGDKAAAEADYNEAIKLAGTDIDGIDSYVALAQLLWSQGRQVEAQSKLDEARTKLPKSVTLYKALGDLSAQAGRYGEAEANYQNALQMDPQDISTRFRLGTVLRRVGKFDAASEAFDKVTEADKDYPGLALERAVLYEASGQSSKAVELYESALAKAPNDPDLMLRVASALLAASQPGPRAEELLRKVMQQRQNSAEANHFLGRALLVKGTNLAEALRNLKRATDLDPNRAEYFLYVGWAANLADDQALAATSLARALELDKSLADAYWQRGVLRHRQRALADAEMDLNRALELRPSRFEAYATLAQVYEDQQKWPQAQAAWQKAISANGNEPFWRFRLGKLLYDHGSRPASLEHLSQAVQLASQLQSPPQWMAQACLLLGEVERAAGKKELAIEHLQRFLSLAPLDSPYRADAQKSLKLLGVAPPLAQRPHPPGPLSPCCPSSMLPRGLAHEGVHTSLVAISRGSSRWPPACRSLAFFAL